MIAELVLCGHTIIQNPQNNMLYNNYGSSNCIIEYYSEADGTLIGNIRKLRSFLDLERGWNTYDAPPFSANHIAKVEQILNNLTVQPKVFPTGRQSIQLEYEKDNGDYLEFEVFEDGATEVLLIIGESEEEFTITDAEIKREVDKFYASR